MTALTSIPSLAAADVAALPWLTVAQMIEVDRAMVDDLGIVLLQMMEHAGRRLAAWGANVSVLLSASPARFAAVPRHQLDVLTRLGVDASDAAPLRDEAPDLILDGVIGYSPRGRAADLIRAANASPAPVLALDVPSGLDSTTGAAADPVIHAAATSTLTLPKQGLRGGTTRGIVGELYLADIGVSPWLYGRPPLGLTVPDPFAHSDLVRLS